MENMKRINNGYADYYYLFEDGRIYNSQTNQIIQANEKHFVYLRTQDNRRKKVALRTLYWIVYRKHYCIDEIQNLDGEVWKEIDNTDGYYFVSNKGRIKSYKGFTAIILKPFINNIGGYERVDIVQEGKRQTKLVHRLVAAAFLPMPCNIDMNLHHKDFNKTNNLADNLQWLSASEHKKKHLKQNNRRRKNNNG